MEDAQVKVMVDMVIKATDIKDVYQAAASAKCAGVGSNSRHRKENEI